MKSWDKLNIFFKKILVPNVAIFWGSWRSRFWNLGNILRENQYNFKDSMIGIRRQCIQLSLGLPSEYFLLYLFIINSYSLKSMPSIEIKHSALSRTLLRPLFRIDLGWRTNLFHSITQGSKALVSIWQMWDCNLSWRWKGSSISWPPWGLFSKKAASEVWFRTTAQDWLFFLVGEGRSNLTKIHLKDHSNGLQSC